MRVLVLDGNENQAVAAARSLGAAGFHVTVGSDARWSKAAWSRCASASVTYPAPQNDASAFVDAIVAWAVLEPGSLVLPMTERTTLPLSANRQRLAAVDARFVLPPHETVLRAFDKESIRQLAVELSISVPETHLVHDLDQARESAAQIGFPVVLKPRSSEVVASDGSTHSTGAPTYASNATELERTFRTVSSRVTDVLVQEYVEGEGTGYFALLRHGKLRAEFAHRRIRDVRPTGSGSAVRESAVVDAALRDAGLRLLERLEWHGVAMVEFRRTVDGRLVLLEVNGRFWNSLALPIHAGVDFPRMLATLALEGDVEPTAGYRTGVRCRWILGDVRHLLAVMAGPPTGFPGRFPGRWRTLMNVLRPTAGMRHDNLLWNDPLPAIGDVLDFGLRRLPANVMKRLRSRA